MSSTIRNIIIFVVIAAALILIYLFFIKGSPAPEAGLVSSTGTPVLNTGTPSDASIVATGDFLTLLLNVKNIKLNTAILSDPSFNSLHDSSIVLTPDFTEGRPNPFAQFGNDIVVITTPTTPPTTPPATTPTIPPTTPPTIPPVTPPSTPPATPKP